MKKIISKFNMLLLLALIVISGNSAAFADFSFRDMELNFVQISDTHISDSEDTSYKALSSSKALLKDAIDQVNAMNKVDFVMFTGDMVNEPLKDSYRDFFVLASRLKYPSLTVFGNHDMRQTPVLEENMPPYISKAEAIEIIKSCNPFYIFDKSYYAFSPRRDYRVIVLDTTIDDTITANGVLTDEAAEFLKNEIETHKDKVILIFQHHPVHEPFKSAHHKILNSDVYLDIIRQYKKTPIAIFSGHYHAAKITKQGNIVHVSTPSLVTYPNAFRHISITNYDDRTIFKIKYYETGLDEVQKKSKLSVIAAATLKGLAGDHDAEITIRKSRNNNNEIKEKKQKLTKEDKQMQKEMREAQKQAQREAKARAKAEEKAQKQAEKEAKLKAKDEAKMLKSNEDEPQAEIEDAGNEN